VLALACSLACVRNDHLAAELAAIQSMRSILVAEVQYYSQYGKYADTLAALGSGGLIPPAVASGEKDGYVFTLALKPVGFAIQAAPKVFGQTGGRTFFCNQDGVIRQNVGPEPATENSPEVK
jgi:hypothetical protein